MDPASDHYLLLIDLKESTRLAPKAAERLFGRLEARLAELNRRLDPTPVLGLTISYGDEVAGLFDTPIHLCGVVEQVRDCLHPEVGIRFVAVRGPIGRLSDDIRQVGGEVFKRADLVVRRPHDCAMELDTPPFQGHEDHVALLQHDVARHIAIE